MRRVPLIVLAAILFIGSTILPGCVPGLRSAKPLADSESPADVHAESTDQAASPKTSTGSDRPPKPIPRYTPPPPPAADEGAAMSIDPVVKQEISDSALAFSKHIPDVKHVKLCYSKLFGGWYVFLYTEKGKKHWMQQYAWNAGTKEWDVVLGLKELSKESLDFELKGGEVKEEKCFLLK